MPIGWAMPCLCFLNFIPSLIGPDESAEVPRLSTGRCENCRRATMSPPGRHPASGRAPERHISRAGSAHYGHASIFVCLMSERSCAALNSVSCNEVR